MYYDDTYYEDLGITEYDLQLVEEYERLFPEPTDEDIELYMENSLKNIVIMTKIRDSLNYHNNHHQSHTKH